MRAVIVVAFVLATFAYVLHVDYLDRAYSHRFRTNLADMRAKLVELRAEERYEAEWGNAGPAIAPAPYVGPNTTYCYHGTDDPACYPLAPSLDHGSGYCTGPSPFDCTSGSYEEHVRQLERLREIERRIEELLIRSGEWRPA